MSWVLAQGSQGSTSCLILTIVSHLLTIAECSWLVSFVTRSGLLVSGGLWSGAIYNFLEQGTVITGPNGIGMFLSNRFLLRYNDIDLMDKEFLCLQLLYLDVLHINNLRMLAILLRPYPLWCLISFMNGFSFLAPYIYFCLEFKIQKCEKSNSILVHH